MIKRKTGSIITNQKELKEVIGANRDVSYGLGVYVGVLVMDSQIMKNYYLQKIKKTPWELNNPNFLQELDTYLDGAIKHYKNLIGLATRAKKVGFDVFEKAKKGINEFNRLHTMLTEHVAYSRLEKAAKHP